MGALRCLRQVGAVNGLRCRPRARQLFRLRGNATRAFAPSPPLPIWFCGGARVRAPEPAAGQTATRRRACSRAAAGF
eukprot:358727-Chlamydomonas_euryale.AAC.12